MRIPFVGGIGVPELVIILIVVLLIFGPKNLPKLGNAIGKTVKNLRDGMSDGKEEAAAKAEEAAAKTEKAEAKAVEVEAKAEEVETKTEGEDSAAEEKEE